MYLLSHSAVEITRGKGSSNVRNHRWLLFIYRGVITVGNAVMSVSSPPPVKGPSNFYMLNSFLL